VAADYMTVARHNGVSTKKEKRQRGKGDTMADLVESQGIISYSAG